MNRKVLIGCAAVVVAVVALIVVAVFSFAPQAFQKGSGWVKGIVADVNRRSAIEEAWKPPGAAPDAAWFPSTVEGWTLSVSEEVTALRELNLDRVGRRGKYRGDKQDIEVTVVPANTLERDGIFTRAEAALETGGGRA